MPVSGDSMAHVVANPSFGASAFFRLFWGDGYRDAWTVQITVPVLDLDSFAGGLRVVREIPGNQDRRLLFEDPLGQPYLFRSVHRDPQLELPTALRGTFAELVVQEEVATTYPVPTLVIQPLLMAADLASVDVYLFVLPDDPRLAEHRREFAGMLGFLAHVTEGLEPRLPEVAEVIDSKTLFELARANPRDRPDAHALLRARLLDVVIGDWNRSPRNWRWATLRGQGNGEWIPLPVQRDQAFAKLDGVFPSKAWIAVPELVGFGSRYHHVGGLTLAGAPLDRAFLTALEKPAWDSTAHRLAGALSDSVIEVAVNALPREMYALDGKELATKLRRRRDALAEAANEYYRILAATVDVDATDRPEIARITGEDDGSVEVSLAPRGDDLAPYYRRRFQPHETGEVRLHLRGGNDSVVISADRNIDMTVRIIGGPGDDVFDFLRPVGNIDLYDADGTTRVIGAADGHPAIDRRPYTRWVYEGQEEKLPRDWGQWTVPNGEIGLSGDYGLYLAGGVTHYTYGFRKAPYASRTAGRFGVSTKGKVEFLGHADFRATNSPNHAEVRFLASSRRLLKWYGLGNDTQPFATSDSALVDRWIISLDLALARTVGRVIDALFGPVFKHNITTDNDGHFIATEPDLYGDGNFGQLGAFGELRFDSRDNPWAPTRGFTLSLRGDFYPPLFDVRSIYGAANVLGTAYLSLPVLNRPVLALRAGGRRIWGPFPYFESAYLGGLPSNRGWDRFRFAGDASLYGGTDVRFFLFDMPRVIPGQFGGFLLADVGRVYVDGESPGGWHPSAGLGVWFTFLGNPKGTFSASIARSQEKTVLYANYGFQF